MPSPAPTTVAHWLENELHAGSSTQKPGAEHGTGQPVRSESSLGLDGVPSRIPRVEL